MDFTLPGGQVLNSVIIDFIGRPLDASISMEPTLSTDVERVTIAGEIDLSTSGDGSLADFRIAPIGETNFIGDRHASFFEITPTGSIHFITDGALVQPVGLGFFGYGVPIINDGLIDVRGQTTTIGVLVQTQNTDFGPAITNGGTIHVVSASGAAEGVVSSGEFGVFNDGTIDVSGQLGSIGVTAGDPGLFQNTGSIVVHDLTAGGLGIGVQFNTTMNAHFLNAGLIQADLAISVDQSDPAGTRTADLNIYENTGHIVGDIDLNQGNQTLLNENSIVGATDLGSGDDVYDGRHGTETGLLQGGFGNDTLMGGAGFDNLQGNQGDDSLSGGAGDDYVVGGKDNDQQFGDDGDDIVWGNLGNDTLDGGNGNDQVRGGQGDDSLSGGLGDDFISGDRGNDTESGGAGADIFHTFSGAGVDRVLDFNLAEGDRVMVDPGTTFSVSQVGGDTVIDMGNGDQMILVGVQMSTLTGSWIFGA